MNSNSRLPRNFHKSFKPERQYINSMLRFAAAGKSGDFQEMSKATGIPMGASSGKVPAILDYCRGMGLIVLSDSERTAVKTPLLTPFGRIVLLEDPFLKMDVTQWIAHLNLCTPKIGAEVWYQVFCIGSESLGRRFERFKLNNYLGLSLGVDNTNLIGPLVGTYEDEAALHLCGALQESEGVIRRISAPIYEEFGFGYGAWLLQLIEDHFPKAGQISTTELDLAAGWRTTPGWDSGTHQSVLDMIERKGLIDVDRHMEPWIIRSKMKAERAWNQIYDDIL